jgi:hypothetical protein
MPMRMRTIALPTEPSFRLRIAVAAAAAALALFAIPHQAHAQGVFNGMERGANQGAYEGHRAAGPVGGAIGGAIGAGVGVPSAASTACSAFRIADTAGGIDAVAIGSTDISTATVDKDFPYEQAAVRVEPVAVCVCASQLNVEADSRF